MLSTMENSGDKQHMNKKTVAAVIFLFCIAAVIISIKYEKLAYNRDMKPSSDMTDEDILSTGYFDVLVPADENKHLHSDVVSYSLGDGYVHIVLPDAVSEKFVVAYIRDIDGNYLSRREWDFTKDVFVGNWQIVVDHTQIPNLYFESSIPGSFETMTASETTDVLCFGNMQLCVDEQLARKNKWYSEYLSAQRSETKDCSAVLQGRGSSSWDCESKKSFSLRLNKSMNLLGMGSHKNWNLIGSAYDASLLKNTVFNEMSKKAGIKYQPKMQAVNLYVDSKYQGVYILTTKVSVGKDKIALSKRDYLYKMDPPSYDQPIKYNSILWFEDGNTEPIADLLYPEEASEKVLEDARQKLQRAVDAIENPLSEDLYELVDVDSLIRYYWIQEAGMNFDAWQRSVYIYYSAADGKIHFGPVWDMDITLGSPYEKMGMAFDYPEGFRIRNAGWYISLFMRDDFKKDVKDIYFNGGIRDVLFDGIDEFARQKEELGQDAYLNFTMYGFANQGTTLMYGESYDEYCDNMIDFYKERINWIDSQMMSE